MPPTISYFPSSIRQMLAKQLLPSHGTSLYFPRPESNHDNSMLQPDKTGMSSTKISTFKNLSSFQYLEM